MMDDLTKKTVPELKKILSQRGVSTTGKRREELLTLARKAVELYDAREECDHEDSERKRRRVIHDDGTIVDLHGKTVTWTSKLKDLPAITCSDIFAYLLVECKWSSQRLKQHRKDDGYMMYRERHVEDVVMGKILGHSDHMYIRAKVKPEQRFCGERYTTWVLCSTGGEIKSAGCGCVAA